MVTLTQSQIFDEKEIKANSLKQDTSVGIKNTIDGIREAKYHLSKIVDTGEFHIGLGNGD